MPLSSAPAAGVLVESKDAKSVVPDSPARVIQGAGRFTFDRYFLRFSLSCHLLRQFRLASLILNPETALHPFYCLNAQRIQTQLQRSRRHQRQFQAALAGSLIRCGKDRAVFIEA